MSDLATLLTSVRECRICESVLPHGPRPVLQVGRTAKILIAGQAPGRRVHESGVPFDDPSGERLRDWLGVDRETFYDSGRIAILPMGFCYPGSGKSGDLPPRPECAPAWRAELLSHLTALKLTVVLGKWAMQHHLGIGKRSLTDTVRDWRQWWPTVLPLPHPSPRNQGWFQRNPWFELDVLPALRERTATVLS